VIKRQFDYQELRFKGLAKNIVKILTLFALSNLWMARKKLMSIAGNAVTYPAFDSPLPYERPVPGGLPAPTTINQIIGACI
jgi:IS5 family transposase